MTRLISSIILLGLVLVFGIATQFAIQQYRLMAAEIDALRVEAALIQRETSRATLQQAADPALLVRGGSEAVAQAGLLDFVKSVVEAAGGQVVLLQPRILPDAEAQGIIALRAQFNADTAGLQAALHAVEASKPALLVDSLLLRGAGRGGDGTATRTDATLDLRAYRYPE